LSPIDSLLFQILPIESDALLLNSSTSKFLPNKKIDWVELSNNAFNLLRDKCISSSAVFSEVTSLATITVPTTLPDSSQMGLKVNSKYLPDFGECFCLIIVFLLLFTSLTISFSEARYLVET